MRLTGCIGQSSAEKVDTSLTLSLVEELRRIRKVRQNEERRDRAKDGEEAFQDENPCPARFTTDTVHVGDGCSKKPTCKMTVQNSYTTHMHGDYPLNAPAIVADEKKTPTRVPSSSRLYQLGHTR